MDSVVEKTATRFVGRWMYVLGALPALCVLFTAGCKKPHTIVAEAFSGLVITLSILLLRRQARAVTREAARLKETSETDALTGLRNRRGMREHIEKARALAEAHGEPLSLAFFDLDGFKGVNDKLGHAAGDRLLATVALVLKGSVRAGVDEAFRLGGDEFVVVMRGTSAQGARKFADRVREELKAHPAISTLPVAVDVSAGVASAVSGETADALIARADEAMFRAKARGKGCTAGDTVEQPVRMRPRLNDSSPGRSRKPAA